ncbi:translation protein [Umbelopsis sp. PMI_123]|nr:translation protein [Umbelopsis sp. PMI_123]
MNSFTKLLPSITSAVAARSSRPIIAACLHSSAMARQASSTSDQQPTWTAQSQRVGVIARKKGMSTFWDEWGARMPTTILQLEDVQVLDVRTEEKHGYTALQVGCTNKKNVTKPVAVHYSKLNVEPKQSVAEFRVTEDAVLPVGTILNAAHFVPGQYVDVTAPSIGKGFAGVMKRWNFGGLPASHGVSLAHRSAGSTGQRKWPSKVFKGKKMAGRMGGKSVTVQSLKVLKIDTELNLIYVKGCVPGFDDQFVKIKDAVKKHGAKLFPSDALPPPFPTVTEDDLQAMPRELIANSGEGKDPFTTKE